MLTAILLLIVVVLFFLGPRDNAVETAVPEQEVEDSLVSQVKRDRQQWHKQHYSNNRQPKSHFQEVPLDTTPIQRYHRPAQPMAIELNSVDTLGLIQLRGIGPVFSRRIVRYRERLGGYVCKEQLLEVYGMTDSLYRKISPYVEVDSSALRKISLNSATIEELKSHPYLNYYQAKAIVTYRQKAGSFHSLKELQKVSLIDDETYRTLLPYLQL